MFRRIIPGKYIQICAIATRSVSYLSCVCLCVHAIVFFQFIHSIERDEIWDEGNNSFDRIETREKIMEKKIWKISICHFCARVLVCFRFIRFFLVYWIRDTCSNNNSALKLKYCAINWREAETKNKKFCGIVSPTRFIITSYVRCKLASAVRSPACVCVWMWPENKSFANCKNILNSATVCVCSRSIGHRYYTCDYVSASTHIDITHAHTHRDNTLSRVLSSVLCRECKQKLL